MATDHSVDKNAAKPVKKFWPIPAPEVPAPDAARLRRAYQGESFKPAATPRRIPT